MSNNFEFILDAQDGSMLKEFQDAGDSYVFRNGDQWYCVIKNKDNEGIAGFVFEDELYMYGALAERIENLGRNDKIIPINDGFYIIAVTNIRNPNLMVEPKPTTNSNNEFIHYQGISVSDVDEAFFKDTLIRWFRSATIRV